LSAAEGIFEPRFYSGSSQFTTQPQIVSEAAPFPLDEKAL
jgi:hypothetical protein